jgi:hypothetical protein
MSLFNVAMNLTRLVPDSPLARCQTAVYRGLEAIYDQVDWSWQRCFAGWLAPGMVIDSIGTTTTTPYSNLVIGDATASLAFATYFGQPFLTQLQYRNPAFAIYDIVSMSAASPIVNVAITTPGSGQTDGVYTVSILDGGPGTGGTAQVTVVGGVVTAAILLTAGTGYLAPYITFSQGGTPATLQVIFQVTLTLDRPWMEPGSGSGQPYYIYQHYFVSPVPDFRKWIAIQDFTNSQALDFWSLTRADLANIDPQRQDQSLSTNVVPAGIDQRAGSATFGWQRFELYPWQGNLTPYTLTYRRRGQLPESQNDWMSMYPEHPITENMVEFKAKEILLLDKSAEMEAKVPGSGKGMVLLATMAQKTYYELFGQVLSIDLNLDGENFTHVNQPGRWNGGESYASYGPNGRLNVGGYYGRGGV